MEEFNVGHACPGCFKSKGSVEMCPHCGYDESIERSMVILPHRTTLHGKYVIGRVLGKLGGFGITYLAYDKYLSIPVAIKEYLPREVAHRGQNGVSVASHSQQDGELFRFGLQQFLEEARIVAGFDHAHLVRVRDYFEENGTGYLVMNYYQGMTLAEFLEKQPENRVSEQLAIGIMQPILDGLREVHDRGILHRDIKPANIYLADGKRPVLLDFGAARVAMGEKSKSLSVVLTPGYAPPEQYYSRGKQGPWTDIYGCAAVMYRMLSGETPPEAPARIDGGDELRPLPFIRRDVRQEVAEAVHQGLNTATDQRPQDVASFQLALEEGSAGAAQQVDPGRNNIEKPQPVMPIDIKEIFSEAGSGLSLASWKRRLVNNVIDTIASSAITIFFVYFCAEVLNIYLEEWFVFISILISIFYFTFGEFVWGKTFGKLITGTKVVNLNNGQISFGQALGRTLCRAIPFEIFSFLAKYPRGWHDRIPNTYVIVAGSKNVFASQSGNGNRDKSSTSNRLMISSAITCLFFIFAYAVYTWNGRPSGNTYSYESEAVNENNSNQSRPGQSSENAPNNPNSENIPDSAEDITLLGLKYLTGDGVAEDHDKAFDLISRAARMGFAHAQFVLSVMYDDGIGVEKDPYKSFEWCRKAALQDQAEAMLNLAVNYYKGIGVEKNIREAKRWMEKAAEQGNEKARSALEAINAEIARQETNNESIQANNTSPSRQSEPSGRDLSGYLGYGRATVTDMVRANIGEIENLLSSTESSDNESISSQAVYVGRSGWNLVSGTQRNRNEARRKNDEALAAFHQQNNIQKAFELQAEAFRADPLDREIVGNLAIYALRFGDSKLAQSLAVYALSLPRGSGKTGRTADWATLAAAYAVQGDQAKARQSLYVTLAIAPDVAMRCYSAVESVKRTYTPELRQATEAMFRRVQNQGLSSDSRCSLPIYW